MSVYIKNMEMPKYGFAEIRIYPDGSITEMLEGYEMPVGKAVPVPPHGDLIDRNPFIDFIKTHWDSYDQWFVEQLEARPTIIEAEEGK